MDKLTLRDLDIDGKKVLMRVDFNTPLDERGEVADDTRIRASLPSIRYILEQGGRLILMSHLGRPKGVEPSLSLAPCARVLSRLLNHSVELAPDCIGPQVTQIAEKLARGDILLLENLRFHPAEEDPTLDPSFAQKLASLADLYVNDAFAAAHRAHSSTATIAEYFPGKAAAGLLLQKEIEVLTALLLHPKRPFYAIIGGAKISTKIGVLNALSDKINALFIGGGMAYPFLEAQGIAIGDSLCPKEAPLLARQFLQRCEEKKLPLYLPQDLLIASSLEPKAHTKIIPVSQGIPPGWQGVDIGPLTLQEWNKHLTKAATLFWNGPVGIYENPAFARGTQSLALTLASLSATTVVGGGDSVAAIQHLHLEKRFTHLSTGGGACLEWIEFGHLPGIEALSKKA